MCEGFIIDQNLISLASLLPYLYIAALVSPLSDVDADDATRFFSLLRFSLIYCFHKYHRILSFYERIRRYNWLIVKDLWIQCFHSPFISFHKI